MKKTVRKLLSLLLGLVMVCSQMPVQAFAVDSAASEKPVISETLPSDEEQPAEGPAAPPAAEDKDPAPAEEDALLLDEAVEADALPQRDVGQEVTASGVCGDRLGWILTDDGVLTISGDGAMNDYTWDSSSGTTAPWYPYRAQIVEVVLPEGITSIGDQAFRNCLKMASINLPQGITSIGASAFAFCNALTAVTIPGTLQSMGGSAFYSCAGLQTLVIEEGVPSLGTYAFYNCASLTSVTLPQSLQTINAQAFMNTSELTSITVPKRVTNIGAKAFAGSGLTEVRFTCFAPTFGSDVFLNCTLTAYYPGADITWTEDVRQQYGGTITWTPVIQSYDLYIAGTQVTEARLEGLIDNTFAWHYYPDTEVLTLQGNYNLPSDYSYEYVISNGIEGLTIRMDNSVLLYAPADKDLSFLVLNADTTIKSASSDYQLQVNGNTGLTTGAQVADGVRLTLEDTDLFFSGLTYGLVGGSGSKLDLIRSTGDIRGSWGAVRSFSGGISMQNCEITVPENYTTGSDYSICGSSGSTAPRVSFEPSYGLVIDGVPVTSDNMNDVLDNGVFSFDGVHTLTVSGDYTGTEAVLIDSMLPALVVNTPGVAVLTNGSSAEETALIRSRGDLFLSGNGNLFLQHAANAGDNSYGILMRNNSQLRLQGTGLSVKNVAYGLSGSEDGYEQSLDLYNANLNINTSTAAVTGFDGGITKTGCEYVYPAYTVVQNGAMGLNSIVGFEPIVNLEITTQTVYDLVIDGTRVYAGNLDDIRGAGVFAYDPATNTLSVSGTYAPDSVWAASSINSFQPVIDNSIPDLTILVAGETTLTGYLENYNSCTPVVNSTKRFTIRGTSELDTPVLKLTASSSAITYDGIHTNGQDVTLENVNLKIGEETNSPRYALLGDGGTITFRNSRASIMTQNDGVAVHGFSDIVFEDCKIVSKGVTVENGSFFEGGELAKGVIISNKAYNILIDGYMLYEDRLEMNFGTIVYDPDTNTLFLNGTGEAPVASAGLPYIENHNSGLTIYVENAIKLPTTSETTGRGIIETDVNMTIRSNNCYLALEGNGNNTAGIIVKNGATLTLDGARINILSTGHGILGMDDAKLNINRSWVHVRDAGISGIEGFSGGLSTEESTLHTPSDGLMNNGAVYESGGSTLAKTVEFFGTVYELNINGTWVTYENKNDILGDGTFSYDSGSKTLTIKKSFTSGERATLISNQINGLTISLSKDITLTNNYNDIITSAICSTSNLTITGGKLTLHGNGQSHSYGIELFGNNTSLTLKNTSIVTGNVSCGLTGNAAGQKLIINNSTMECASENAAITLFNGGIEMTDCAIIQPQNYICNDDGTICDENGVKAPNVTIEKVYLWLGDIAVTTVNASDILGDGAVSFDYETSILNVNGDITIEGSHKYDDYHSAVIFASLNELKLVINGSLTINSPHDGIHIHNGTFTYEGPGELNINTNSYGIYGGMGIYIKGGIVNTSGGTRDQYSYAGLCSYGKTISILGGEVTSSGRYGIRGDNSCSIVVNGGKLTATGTQSAMKVYQGSITIGNGMALTAPVGGINTGRAILIYGDLDAKRAVIEPAPASSDITYYPVWICETVVTSENKNDILGDGLASYDPETKTLTIKGNKELSESTDPLAEQKCNARISTYNIDLTLVVEDSLTITNIGNGISVEGSLIYEGPGELNITSTAGNGIYGAVVIKGGIVNTSGGTHDQYSYAGLCSYGKTISILGGEVTSSGRYGIRGDNSCSIVVNGGKLTATGTQSAMKVYQGSITIGKNMIITTPEQYEVNKYVYDISDGSVIAKKVVVEPKSNELDVAISHSCAFGNNLSIGYLVKVNDLTGYSNFKFIVSGTELTDYDTITSGSTQYYRFVYSNIAAKQMGDMLTAVFYADKDGVTYQTAADEYSVKTYAYNRLANSTDATFKKLMVDMLNYGAAAQVYFGYDTGNLVNAELTAEQRALGTQGTPVLTPTDNTIPLDGATVTFAGKNVGFSNSIELRFYMRLAEGQSTDNVKLVLSYTAADGAAIRKVIPYSEFGDYNTTTKYGTISTISAKDMSAVITAIVYDGDTRISDTLEYSIETYVYNRLQNSTDENFKTLITELMKYGKTAEEYFQSQQQ